MVGSQSGRGRGWIIFRMNCPSVVSYKSKHLTSIAAGVSPGLPSPHRLQALPTHVVRHGRSLSGISDRLDVDICQRPTGKQSLRGKVIRKGCQL